MLRNENCGRALSLLEEMYERGVTLDVISLGTFRQGRKWAWTLSLPGELRCERGVMPDVISFGEMGNGSGRCGSSLVRGVGIPECRQVQR